MSIDDPQKQKLVAAIEQLEAEFQRRQEERQRELDEKFAQGHVRVVGIPSEADKEFEGVIIVTGVPRAERDQETPEWRRLIEERSPSYPTRPHRPKATSEAKNGPADVWQPESEPRPVRATIARPTERTHGVVVEASYTTIGNIIRVRDLQGRLYTERFNPDDDLDGSRAGFSASKPQPPFTIPFHIVRRAVTNGPALS